MGVPLNTPASFHNAGCYLAMPYAGYVQGMSDILALPLMVLNNEHQAFWCFDFVMKTTVNQKLDSQFQIGFN